MCEIDIYRYDIQLRLRECFSKALTRGVKNKDEMIQNIYEDLYIEYSDNCPEECILEKVRKFVEEIYVEKHT